MIPVEEQERFWTWFMRSDFGGRIYKVDNGFAGLPQGPRENKNHIHFDQTC